MDKPTLKSAEIDALKEDNKHLSENLDCVSREASMLEEECSHLEDQLAALKAENERLRKDAERYVDKTEAMLEALVYMIDDGIKYTVLYESIEKIREYLRAAMKDFSTQPKEE